MSFIDSFFFAESLDSAVTARIGDFVDAQVVTAKRQAPTPYRPS
jgi:hypothetical protein